MRSLLLLVVSSVLLTATAPAAERPVVGLTALHAMERILQHEAPLSFGGGDRRRT